MWARVLAAAALAAAALACGRIDVASFGGSSGQPDGSVGGAGGVGNAAPDAPSAAACDVVHATGSGPLVSWDGSGYGVMWFDAPAGSGGTPGLYLQRVGATGALVGAPRLAVAESGSSYAGELATGTGYAVTWFDATTNRLDFVRLDATGAELGSPGIIGGVSASVLFGPPSYAFYVEPLTTGYAVLWMGTPSSDMTMQQMWLSTTDASGAKTAGDVDLSAAGAFELIDGVAAHDNVFAIVHSHSVNGSNTATLLGQRDASGALIGKEMTLEANVDGTASIAWSGDHYGVVWHHEQGAAIEIAFATYDASLARLTGPVVLATARGGGDFLSTAVAWTGRDFVAAWAASDNASNLTLQYARITDDGVAAATTTTLAGATGPLYLAAAGGGGSALLSWTVSGGLGGGIAAVCDP